MSVTISRDFEFSASHHLPRVRAGHKCGRVHGHNYLVRVSVEGRVDPATGMVIDFGDLAPIRDWIDEHLDHRDLNDVLDNPTSEQLAVLLLEIARRLVTGPSFAHWSVGVSETPRTWATARS